VTSRLDFMGECACGGVRRRPERVGDPRRRQLGREHRVLYAPCAPSATSSDVATLAASVSLGPGVTDHLAPAPVSAYVGVRSAHDMNGFDR
jgi:hypothetical protein